MGEVFRSKDTRRGRDFAIKVLPQAVAADPGRMTRLEHESRSLSAPNHPSVLTVFDIGTPDGFPFLVTELLEGENLREKLRGRPFPVKTVIDIAVHVALGLAAAHAKGFIRRDLEPENIFITRNGHPNLLGFGLAKLEHPVGARARGAMRQCVRVFAPHESARTSGSPPHVRWLSLSAPVPSTL